MRFKIQKTLIAISVLLVAISGLSASSFAASISEISAQETREDIAISIPFLVTASGNVSYTHSSSDQSLIPNAYLLYQSDGKYYTMVATPAFNAVGTATISITVTDDDGVTSTSFEVTVTDVDDSLSYWENFQAADVVIGESGVSFNQPSGVAVDPLTGKLFVSDSGNNQVLRFASADAVELSGATSEAILGVTTTTMNNPIGIHVDTFGSLWVADSANHRILRYDNASTKESGAAADGVLGQTDFQTSSSGTSAYSMRLPSDVWMDPSGRLWVADMNNHRVLRFDNAGGKENGSAADGVLGQDSFSSASSGNSQSKMNTPISIIGSTKGHLFVSDMMNHRVLCFTDVVNKSYLANADKVYGQSDFDTKNSSDSETGMKSPSGLSLDVNGTLYVADFSNHRVLAYNDINNKDSGSAADYVLGQKDFGISYANAGGDPTPKTLNYPYCLNVDLPNNRLWVPDYGNNRVLRFTPSYRTKPILGPINSQSITENTTESISFTVTDSNNQSLTITYQFSDASMLTSESFEFTGDQVAYNGTSYTVSASSTPTTITLNLKPETEKSGSATITITVTDPDGFTDKNSFLLTVNSVNDEPVISSIDNQTMNEDTTSTAIPFSITDIEGVEMIVTVQSSDETLFPSNAANITLSNKSSGNTYTLTSDSGNDSLTLFLKPVSNQSGSATITITVSDGVNEIAKAFTMTVTSVNDAPEISTLSNQTFAEDTQSETISFTVSDVDSGKLTITVISSNPEIIPSDSSNMTLSNKDGGNSYTLTTTSTPDQLTLQLMPAANQNGAVTMTVIADDGSMTATNSFNITITPVNDIPTILSIASLTTNEDQELTGITFQVNDVESSNLTITIQSSNITLFPENPKNITLSHATGGTSYTLATSSEDLTLALMPANNQSGTANITIVVSDGTDITSTSFVVNVTPAYDRPEISAIANIETNEDTESNAIAFKVSNPDQDTLTITITAPDAQNITLKNATKTNNPLTTTSESETFTLTLLPKLNSTDPITITVTVNNDTEDVVDTFTMSITPVNDAPTISSIPDKTINEDDSSGTINIIVADAENDSLTIEVQSSNTDLLPYAAANIQLSNSNGGTTYSLVTNPESLTLVLTPLANQNGSAIITVTVKDATETAQTSFRITVTEINDPPSINTISDMTTIEDIENPIAISFTIVDVENEQLTITVLSSKDDLIPANTITIENGTDSSNPLVTSPGGLTLMVQPLANQSGTAYLTVTVEDAKSVTSTSFAITVTEINDPPDILELSDCYCSTNEDEEISDINFKVKDIDANTLNISIETSDSNLIPADAQHITFCNADTCNNLTFATTKTNTDSLTLTLLPKLNQSGTVMLTVTVSDGITPTSQSFTLSITSVNDAPVIAEIIDQTIDEDTSIVLAFTATDIEDSACLTIETTATNQEILANNNISTTCNGGSYTLTATPEDNKNGSVDISIIATDSEGQNSEKMSFQLSITPVNDAPKIELPDSITTKKNTSTSITGIVISDIDAGNQPVSITLTAAHNDTLTLNAQYGPTLTNTNSIEAINTLLNNLQYQPASDATGTRSITITVNDLGHTGGNPETVSEILQITITNNNIPPVNITPGPLTVNEDEPVMISPHISIYDSDFDTNSPEPVRVTLTSKESSLKLTQTTGVTLEQEASQFIVVTGPISDMNNALATLMVTYTPNFNGTDVLTITSNDLGYTGVDNKPLSDTDSVTITVLPVNDPPEIDLPKTLSLNEDESESFTASVNDPDDTTMHVRLMVANGTLQLNQNTGLTGDYAASNALSFTGNMDDVNNALSLITYTPASDISGAYTITMITSDNESLTDTSEMTVTINAINDTPVISCQPLAYTTNEDTSTSISASISDVDAGDKSVETTILVTNGSIHINWDGSVQNYTNLTMPDTITKINQALSSFDFLPTKDYFGNAAGITITVNDQGNTPAPAETSDAFISIQVNSVNDPPVFTLNQKSISVNEDFSDQQVITVNVSPVDGEDSNNITYSLSPEPESCTFATINLDTDSGTITITKKDNLHGNQIVQLIANDGESENNTYSQSLTLTVAPINDPPSFTIDREDISLNEDFTTTEVIVITPDPVPTDEINQPVTYALSPDTYTWVQMEIDSDSGQITITSKENQHYSQIVQIVADDSIDTYTKTFHLNVSPVNDRPIITSGNVFTLDENLPAGTLVVTITATDADNDELSYDITTVDPEPFAITTSTGQIYLTDLINYENTDAYTLTISVSDGLSPVTQQLNITINNLNDPPVINNVPVETLTTKQDTALPITMVTISDEDAGDEPIQLTIISENGTVFMDGTNRGNYVQITQSIETLNESLKSMTFIPLNEFTGAANLKIEVNDLGYTGAGGAKIDSETINIEVIFSNQPPTFIESSPITTTIIEDSLFPREITLNAQDLDNDPITWTILAEAIHGTATVVGSGASNTIYYQPVTNYNGSDIFVVQISDGSDTNSLTVNVTINPSNDKPVNTKTPSISTSTGIYHFRETLIGNRGDWHDNIDLVPGNLDYDYQWQISENASGENYTTIDGETQNTYVIREDDALKYIRLQVTASDDGEGLPPTQSETAHSEWILISNVAPVFTDESPYLLEMDEDSKPKPFNVTLNATDTDGDIISWTISSDASHGTATVNGTGTSKTIEYQPNENYNGKDSFEVQISDGLNGTDTLTVDVTINPRNDPPVNNKIPSISGVFHVGKVLNGTDGEWNDNLDLKPGTLTYAYQWQRSDTESSDSESFTELSGKQQNTYTVKTEDNLKYIRLKVTCSDDGEGLPPTQSETAHSEWILISNVAPVFTDESPYLLEMDEDSKPKPFNVTLNATDTDGDIISWTISSDASHGTATVNGTGTSKTIEYQPNENYNGKDSFEVQISDGLNGTDTLTVDVTINPRNDPPVNNKIPSISGVFHVGKVLNGTDGQWNDNLDLKPGNLTYAYQWQRSDTESSDSESFTELSGEQQNTYTVKTEDNLKYIRLKVTCTDDGEGLPSSQSETALSEWVLISNVAPVFIEPITDPVEMDEDANPKPFSLTLEAKDNDGDIISWTISSDASHGTATVNGTGTSKKIEYQPNENYNGTDSFEVQISDGLTGKANLTVNVTINPRNDPPVNDKIPSISGVFHVGETLIANKGEWTDDIDVTPGTLKYDYQWQVSNDQYGNSYTDITDAKSVIYEVTRENKLKYIRVQVTAIDDGEGLPESESNSKYSNRIFISNVTPVFEEKPPLIVKMDEDSNPRPFDLILHAIDPDDYTLTWEMTSDPSHGKTTIGEETGLTNTIMYQPASNYNGLDSFDIRIFDEFGGETITVQVDIAAVNDPPNLTMTSSQPTAIEEDHYFDPISFDLKDIDNSQLTVSVDTDHSFFSNISICSGNVCKECANNNCNIQFPFQKRSLTRALKIIQNMTGINNLLTDEQDIDNNTKIGLPESLYYLRDTSTVGALTLHLTPAENESGNEQVTLIVTDASGDNDQIIISTEVTPVSDAPELTAVNSSGNEDTYIDVDIQAELTDLTEEMSKITITNIPVGAVFNNCIVSNNSCSLFKENLVGLQIKPPANSSGIIELEVFVSSQDRPDILAESHDNMTITVNAVPDVPDVVLQSENVTGDEGKKMSIIFKTLRLTDSDGSEIFDRIELTNYPPNATYSAGYVEENKRIIEFDDKASTDKSGWGFTITPSGEDGEYYKMAIAVYSKEKDNGSTAVTTKEVNLSITKQELNEDVSGTCFISTTSDSIKSLSFLKYLILVMVFIFSFQRLKMKSIIGIFLLIFLCTANIRAESISWQNVDYFTFKPMITMESLGSDEVDNAFELPMKTSYSSPLGFQFGLGGIKKKDFIYDATLEYISAFDDNEGGKSNSVDVINVMVNAKYPYPFSDKLTGFGIAGAGIMMSQHDIGFRGKSSSFTNLGLSARLGFGMDWKIKESVDLGMELTTSMGFLDVSSIKFSSLNLVGRYYFDKTIPKSSIEPPPEPEKPEIDLQAKERLESRIVQLNAEIEKIDQNNGSEHASSQYEQMKRYYQQARSALKDNELDKAQILIKKVESDKVLVINSMKKAVYNQIYTLNTYIGQLDSSADLGQVNALMMKAESLAENVEIANAFSELERSKILIAKLLESVCHTAKLKIIDAEELINSLHPSNENEQDIKNRAQKRLIAAKKEHKDNMCKNAIKQANDAKYIAESAVSLIINKDIRRAAQKVIDSAEKSTHKATMFAKNLSDTYGIRIPDKIQLVQNYFTNANNAFNEKQYDDAIKQANLTIRSAEMIMNSMQSIAGKTYTQRIKSLEKKLVRFDQQIERMTFLVQPLKISVPDSMAQNVKRSVKELNRNTKLEIMQKLKRLQSAQSEFRAAQSKLNAISLKPIHARVIIEAAGDDPKAIDFLKAREGLVKYMTQLEKYRIDRKTIDLQPALGYQDQLQFMESIGEVKDSFPMFQADSSFRAQFKKAVHSFSYDEGLRRLVYIVSSRRTFIVPDDLENEIALLKPKSRDQNIEFSCIYIYSGGKPRGKALQNMARKTKGKFYPCKSANDIRDALRDIFKQNQ
jgi:VCBS repeat-containing protein